MICTGERVERADHRIIGGELGVAQPDVVADEVGRVLKPGTNTAQSGDRVAGRCIGRGSCRDLLLL